jgi:hypothetical protein
MARREGLEPPTARSVGCRGSSVWCAVVRRYCSRPRICCFPSAWCAVVRLLGCRSPSRTPSTTASRRLSTRYFCLVLRSSPGRRAKRRLAVQQVLAGRSRSHLAYEALIRRNMGSWDDEGAVMAAARAGRSRPDQPAGPSSRRRGRRRRAGWLPPQLPWGRAGRRPSLRRYRPARPNDANVRASIAVPWAGSKLT